jgi:hypothetical protein
LLIYCPAFGMCVAEVASIILRTKWSVEHLHGFGLFFSSGTVIVTAEAFAKLRLDSDNSFRLRIPMGNL